MAISIWSDPLLRFLGGIPGETEHAKVNLIQNLKQFPPDHSRIYAELSMSLCMTLVTYLAVDKLLVIGKEFVGHGRGDLLSL